MPTQTQDQIPHTMVTSGTGEAPTGLHALALPQRNACHNTQCENTHSTTPAAGNLRPGARVLPFAHVPGGSSLSAPRIEISSSGGTACRIAERRAQRNVAARLRRALEWCQSFDTYRRNAAKHR